MLDCGIHPGLSGMDALPFVDMIAADQVDLFTGLYPRMYTGYPVVTVKPFQFSSLFSDINMLPFVDMIAADQVDLFTGYSAIIILVTFCVYDRTPR